MAPKTITRGYVVVYRDAYGDRKVTAVVSGPRAEDLRKRVGGVIVNAKGEPYKIAQRTLRVIIDPSRVIAEATK